VLSGLIKSIFCLKVAIVLKKVQFTVTGHNVAGQIVADNMLQYFSLYFICAPLSGVFVRVGEYG